MIVSLVQDHSVGLEVLIQFGLHLQTCLYFHGCLLLLIEDIVAIRPAFRLRDIWPVDNAHMNVEYGYSFHSDHQNDISLHSKTRMDEWIERKENVFLNSLIHVDCSV